MKNFTGPLAFILLAFVLLSRAASIAPTTLIDRMSRDLIDIVPLR
jgi:hypothetical protein